MLQKYENTDKKWENPILCTNFVKNLFDHDIPNRLVMEYS